MRSVYLEPRDKELVERKRKLFYSDISYHSEGETFDSSESLKKIVLDPKWKNTYSVYLVSPIMLSEAMSFKSVSFYLFLFSSTHLRN